MPSVAIAEARHPILPRRADALKAGMAQEPNAMEQAVSRALRENLERIQRNADELHQSVADIVSACASSKPTNALPAMLRAQTSAASLTAALEVLARFVAMASLPGPRSPLESQITHLIGATPVEPSPEPVRPQTAIPTPMASAPAPVHTPAPVPPPAAHVESKPAPQVAPPPPPPAPETHPEPELHLHAESETIELLDSPAPVSSSEEIEGAFDVNRLSNEEQELHRRANRVAKVSMQDIKMLRPEQVRLGREKKDLCIRLKDDIEKAHREYDRRFKPIMDHPVDYFYRWMVEILAEGDAHALGEYPYATPARHR
jgi:outer membrane biosynthesis protein TonB